MEKKKFELDKQSYAVMGTCFIIIPMLSDVVFFKFISGKMILVFMGVVCLIQSMLKKQSE